jgi:hypothetical protein
MSRLRPPLNKEDLQVIFDVLNVYDPHDISHVYPEMGEKEFLDGVKIAWHKVMSMLDEPSDEHPDTKVEKNWQDSDFDVDMSQSIWDN